MAQDENVPRHLLPLSFHSPLIPLSAELLIAQLYAAVALDGREDSVVSEMIFSSAKVQSTFGASPRHFCFFILTALSRKERLVSFGSVKIY